MHIYRNLVTDSGGVYPTTCGAMTLGSYNISASSVVDLAADDVPATAYTHQDWPQGCVPIP
jgi:hypothetical protein